jgi:Mg-chelatase subunit ChlD
MAYQIVTNQSGRIFVVVMSDGRIARVVRQCGDQAEAAQLLRDLSGWRF